MIPKTIHYCWFGGNPYSPMIEECLESWNKVLPDYTLKKWDESNTPLDYNLFVRHTYRYKQWGFLSDFVRFHSVFNEGGIYLDVDMMVLKSLDPFLEHSCFTGLEAPGYANLAILGGEAGHPLLKVGLEHLDRFKPRGSKRPKPLPRAFAGVLREAGMNEKDEYQEVMGAAIYPCRYFYPWPFKDIWLDTDYRDYIQPDTVAVHLWDYSWKNELDYLHHKQYEKGFKLAFEKIRKNPMQSPYFYMKLASYGIKYAIRKITGKERKNKKKQ